MNLRLNKKLILQSTIVAVGISLICFSICAFILKKSNTEATAVAISENLFDDDKNNDQSNNSFEPAGTFHNPLNGCDPFTSEFYYYGKSLGKYTIQLMEYKEGEEAWNIVYQNRKNKRPRKGQEYIYIKFIISNVQGYATDAADIVNFFTHFYQLDGTQIEPIGWGTEFENIPCISGNNIMRGKSSTCSAAIVVEKDRSGMLYKLETGTDDAGHPVYTWFTVNEALIENDQK